MQKILLVVLTSFLPITSVSEEKPILFRLDYSGSRVGLYITSRHEEYPPNLIWGQPLINARGILSSQEALNSGMDSRSADDFFLTHSATLTKIEWWGAYYMGLGTFSSVNLEIYQDAYGPTNPPGTSAIWSINVPYGKCDETYVGTVLGDPMYKYHIVLNPADYLNLKSGITYWLCAQPVMDDPPQTGAVLQDQIVGSEIHFSSAYFSMPDWVPASSFIMGQYDWAFNLYGY